MSCWHQFKKEFRLKNLKLKYDFPDDFYLCQWQVDTEVDVCYLIYRFMFMVAFVCIPCIGGSLTLEYPLNQRFRALAYLTVWSILLNAFESMVAFCSVALIYVQQKRAQSTQTQDHKFLFTLYWMCFNLVTELTFFVSITYWGFVHFTEHKCLTVWTSVVHLWNSILMLMDFFVSSLPVRIMHVYLPISLGLIYGLFTYVYYCAGGAGIDGEHYIYQIVDWKYEPGVGAATLAIGPCCAVVARILLFGAYRWKLGIYYRHYYNPRDFQSIEVRSSVFSQGEVMYQFYN